MTVWLVIQLYRKPKFVDNWIFSCSFPIPPLQNPWNHISLHWRLHMATPTLHLLCFNSFEPFLPLCFSENLDDEWFVIFLLFQISQRFPSLSFQIWDFDDDYLLIEAAFHLPRWLNPDIAHHCLSLCNGCLHIMSCNCLPNPSILDFVNFIASCPHKSLASNAFQCVIKKPKEFANLFFEYVNILRICEFWWFECSLLLIANLFIVDFE